MKANELRLDNWIKENPKHWPAGNELQVKNVKDSPYWKQYEGIPITQQWLISFGFKGLEIYIKDIGGGKRRLSFGQNYFYIFIDGDLLARVDYIHQLQNLYFALTGEELKRNE